MACHEHTTEMYSAAERMHPPARLSSQDQQAPHFFSVGGDYIISRTGSIDPTPSAAGLATMVVNRHTLWTGAAWDTLHSYRRVLVFV